MPVAIFELEDEQVQPLFRPVFHFCHTWLALHALGVLNGTIDLGVGSHDLMSGDLMPCHVFPPTNQRVPQGARPQRSKFSSRPAAWHWRGRMASFRFANAGVRSSRRSMVAPVSPAKP